MNPFFGMHTPDKKYHFIAVAYRRRRERCLRHWIGNDSNFVRELRGFRVDRARDGVRRSLETRRSFVKTHLSFRITRDLHVNTAAFGIAQQKWQPERVSHNDVRFRQDRHRPKRINQVEKFQPDERARGIETVHAQMFDAVDRFFARKSGRFARDHHYFVTALNELRRQADPDFLYPAAHCRRYRKERTQDNCDFHSSALGSFKICKSESTARSI